MTAEQKSEIAGMYWNREAALTLRMLVKDENLQMEINGDAAQALRPYAPGHFHPVFGKNEVCNLAGQCAGVRVVAVAEYRDGEVLLGESHRYVVVQVGHTVAVFVVDVPVLIDAKGATRP